MNSAITMSKKYYISIALSGLSLLCSGVQAEQCTVEQKMSVGYRVSVEGKQYLAITREVAEETLGNKDKLTAAEAKLAEANSVLEKAQGVIKEGEVSIAQRDEHIKTLNAQIEDLKAAKAALERMVGVGGITYEAGAGLNTDGKFAALAGVGWRKWRLWGYTQQGDGASLGATGLMIGKEF